MNAATTTERRRRQWVEPVIIALITSVGALITWIRVPADHRDRVWAEDANIFLGEALAHGPWELIFHGYAGYQHFIPRIVIALLHPVLELESYPVVVFAICAVLTGLAAAAVYWLARDVAPWIPARIALALITIVTPLATQETIGNLADLHTYAMWVVPWLLLYRPRTWPSSIAWAVLAFALVMTEIQAVFFVFLIAFGLRRRDKFAWPVFGAFLVGSAIQVATALAGQRNTGSGPLSVPSTVAGWLINTVMPLVTADPETIRAWVLSSGVIVGLVILIPIVAAAIFVFIAGDGKQRLLTATLLLGSAAIYTGSAWANSGPWFMYAELGFDRIAEMALNIRYGVAAGMMLAAVLPIAAAVIVRRFSTRIVARTGAWVICVVTVVTLSFGSTMTVSSRGWVDRWSPAVRAAVQECASSEPDQLHVLPVAPDRSIQLDCETILEFSTR